MGPNGETSVEEKILNTLKGVLRVRTEGVVPILDLDQLYTAIRLDDPEADRVLKLEETLSPGFKGWIGPIPLAPRVCIQRIFTLWGDPVVKVAFGIDSKEKKVGPFYIPNAPFNFEFIKYWEKETVFIYRENTDTDNKAESHIIVAAVMPQRTAWEEVWKPRIMGQVRALKGGR